VPKSAKAGESTATLIIKVLYIFNFDQEGYEETGQFSDRRSALLQKELTRRLFLEDMRILLVKRDRKYDGHAIRNISY
jgi:hypothetical protein